MSKEDEARAQLAQENARRAANSKARAAARQSSDAAVRERQRQQDAQWGRI